MTLSQSGQNAFTTPDFLRAISSQKALGAMVGSEFLDYISKFQVATYVGVEDFADKFNFLVTVTILLLCTTVVTVKQYMMKPISCYMATDIGGKNLLDYVENYCWVQGTVPIAYAGRVPETDAGWEELEKQKLLYYQWVPFVLGLQCILFYIPRVIWQMICYNRTGTDIQHLVLSANQAVHETDRKRTELVQHVARTLEQLLFQRDIWKHQLRRAISRDRYIQLQTVRTGQVSTVTSEPTLQPHKSLESNLKDQPLRRSDTIDPIQHRSLTSLCCSYLRHILCLFSMNHHRGTFLSLSYLFMKLLYLGNAIGQLFMMQHFLGFNHTQTMFGVAILTSILNGLDWKSTLVFPRVAYCYVPIKHLGTKTNTVTAQCVLPVNMLNEKIYIFLWWWVLFVATVTAFSLFRWSLFSLSRTRGIDVVRKYLTLADVYRSADKSLVEEFSKTFLRRDGVFLLRMLSNNAGEIVTSEILAQLWSLYVKTRAEGNQEEYHDSDTVKIEPSDQDGGKSSALATAPYPIEKQTFSSDHFSRRNQPPSPSPIPTVPNVDKHGNPMPVSARGVPPLQPKAKDRGACITAV
ncbi:innexin [Paragonimus westermani]|uniref:Innexin n=1 Tax=Paragonimus westermani TaxID=34504 RepID=A0A5J4P177_9TREM|nr:innexin [Paragonimus westermani]